MNFYPHFIGDYARDTGSLSIMEHGAYRLLLDHVYATEDRLPDEKSECYRICKAMTPAERRAVDKVLDRFFPVNGDGRRHNYRAEEEIEKAKNRMVDDEERKKNERERQRRHRERRAKLFDELRAKGIIPKFDSSTEELERLNNGSVTRSVTEDVTPPVTPNVTRDTTATTTTTITTTTEELTLSPPAGGDVRDGVANVPDCPHGKLVEAYHELLPACPRIAEWNERRAAMMRARWREKATAKGSHKGYRTPEEGLAWWRRYFSYVSQSEFLTGRTEGRDGRPPFVANLEWLIAPRNFTNVLEGNYHR